MVLTFLFKKFTELSSVMCSGKSHAKKSSAGFRRLRTNFVGENVPGPTTYVVEAVLIGQRPQVEMVCASSL